MIDNEKWNVIPIKTNIKEPLVDWKIYQNKNFPKEKLSIYNDCNYAVMCGESSNNLLIIDIDIKKREYFRSLFRDFRRDYPNLSDTYIGKTPSGYHLYYYTPDFISKKTLNKNLIFKEVNGDKIFIGIIKTKYPHLLKGVDILANGYALIPPSKINGREYRSYNSKDIREITKEDLEKIKKFFLLDKPRKMREPFVDILNGIIEIEKQAAKTIKEEFLYWKYLFREGWNFCGLTAQELFPFLEKNQPSFNKMKTVTQLQHHPYTEAPLTNEKLKELFPNYNTNKNSFTLNDTNFNIINKKLDKIIELLQQ